MYKQPDLLHTTLGLMNMPIIFWYLKYLTAMPTEARAILSSKDI